MGNFILVSDLMMCQIAFGVSSKAHQTVLFYACHISLLPYIFGRTYFDPKTSTSTTSNLFQLVIRFYHCKLNENRINTFLNRNDLSALFCVMFGGKKSKSGSLD